MSIELEPSILITGSNGGIGYLIADYLLNRGHRNVICHFRTRREKITQLLEQFDLAPKNHLVYAQLTDEASILAMSDTIQSLGRHVHALLNVAGASTNSVSWKMSTEEFSSVLNDNLLSAFLCSKTFIPAMRLIKNGRIINFSSVTAFSGIAGAAHYSAAKAGLIGLTKSLALELANKSITVNAIALGYFNAGLIDSVPPEIRDDIKSKIPMARFGNGSDVGSAVEYLVSDQASFLTGQTIHLNGGQL